jgi:hypothetical protein
MSLKVVFFYNNGPDGWTETYYANSNDPFNFLTNVPPNIWSLSTAFRAANVDLFAVRATLLGGGARKSYTLALAGKFPSPASAQSSSGLPDAPQVDALFNIVDGAGNHKKTFFRGLIDAQVGYIASGQSIQNAALIKAIQTFISAMGNYQFQLRYQNRPPNSGLTWFTVQSVSPATALGFPQFSFCSTPTAPGIATPQPFPVIFQNVNRNSLPGFPLNTNCIGQSNVSPFGIVIPYLYRNTAAFFPNKNMRFCQQSYSYNAMFLGIFQRFTVHKTGRNFGTPRGRARVVVHSN